MTKQEFVELAEACFDLRALLRYLPTQEPRLYRVLRRLEALLAADQKKRSAR